MANMPKRKKSKDNPYTLIFDDILNKYFVSFNDISKKEQIIEISEDVFEALNKFELEDISQMHKFDKHIEHSELYEETIYKRAINSVLSVEDIVEKKITITELKDAINTLSEKEKKRIKMYYFDDLTLEQISKIEKCSFQAIAKSIKCSIKKLKKLLK